MKYALYLSMLFVLSATAQTKDDGPTMGWSSWNTYRVNISDSLIMQQADAMVAKGLHKVGYKYINIDDGYFGGRDQKSRRMDEQSSCRLTVLPVPLPFIILRMYQHLFP